MRIVNISPTGAYNEGWGYQENLLPKYQTQLGNEVSLIITTREHKDGQLVDTKPADYMSDDGFRVIRCPLIESKIPHLSFALSKINVYDLLVRLEPDLVFFHGLGNRTILQVIRYIKRKNKNCVLVQDTHRDYHNGLNNSSIKGKILNLIHAFFYLCSDRYTSKVYGVTPQRRDIAVKLFGVPSKKADLLIMGADDSKIDFQQKDSIRKKIREENHISDHDFLVITGGKIDQKKNIHLLMNAVNAIDGVKLIVFGNVLEDIRGQFTKELSDKVIWVGWIPSEKVYDYFFAADLVCFPGLHSVLWEQACACKVPCLFAQLEGMDHVNHGGNSDFLYPVNSSTLREKIQELAFTEKYFSMKRIAESEKTDVYFYSDIAKKSLECAQSNDLDITNSS